MDVNRDNFLDVLPEIFQDITDADYVAMDGEFTGILPFHQMGFFDSPAERYRRHYECDRRYLMIQVGLAMIRCINPSENRYSIKAYNFYLYPENELDAFDFASKSSSLQFLAANHFDFTQLFLKGIPFLRQVIFLERLKQQRELEARRQTSNDQYVPINQQQKDVFNQKMSGFSSVIWKLQESGKPLIGHNIYVDLLHIINQFYTPLPPTYEEYTSIVKRLFPKIIDTKLLASTSIFQDMISNTGLQGLYKTVQGRKFPTCRFDAPANFQYALGEHEHTAGYDATCTAMCLAKMMAYIAEQTNFKDNPIRHPLINSLFGKIFSMRSFDMTYIDMINDDVPDRSRVFYVKHPQSWSTSNIREYFQQWGFPFCERYDATTHIVALPLINETTDTLLTKMRAGNTNLNIVSYAQYHQIDLSKIKIRQPNHLFDVNQTKKNSNKRIPSDNQVPIPTESMDLSSPTFESVTSKINPLQKGISDNAALSVYSPEQNHNNSSSNTMKRLRV